MKIWKVWDDEAARDVGWWCRWKAKAGEVRLWSPQNLLTGLRIGMFWFWANELNRIVRGSQKLWGDEEIEDAWRCDLWGQTLHVQWEIDKDQSEKTFRERIIRYTLLQNLNLQHGLHFHYRHPSSKAPSHYPNTFVQHLYIAQWTLIETSWEPHPGC